MLDTSVLVAAIRSPNGASRQLLLSALNGRSAILVSVPLVIEYESVLTRAEHLAASGLSAEDVDELLNALVAVAQPIRLSNLWRPILRDPDDDMVLETAINGGADAIVTFNRRDFPEASARFGIEVFSAGEAWNRVKLL